MFAGFIWICFLSIVLRQKTKHKMKKNTIINKRKSFVKNAKKKRIFYLLIFICIAAEHTNVGKFAKKKILKLLRKDKGTNSFAHNKICIILEIPLDVAKRCFANTSLLKVLDAVWAIYWLLIRVSVCAYKCVCCV